MLRDWFPAFAGMTGMEGPNGVNSWDCRVVAKATPRKDGFFVAHLEDVGEDG